MSHAKHREIIVASLFFLIVGGGGFVCMSLLLDVVASFESSTRYLVSGFLGPILSITVALMLISRGENTLLELCMWFCFPVGFVMGLSAMNHWTDLSLSWNLIVALILSLPLGALSLIASSLIFVPFFALMASWQADPPQDETTPPET